MKAVEKTRLRLVALREGAHPYDRPLGPPPPPPKRPETYSEVRQQARRAGAAEMQLRRRVALIATHADALLDVKLADLRVALRNPVSWQAAVEQLAKAAEAIEMLQGEVARMVPK